MSEVESAALPGALSRLRLLHVIGASGAVSIPRCRGASIALDLIPPCSSGLAPSCSQRESSPPGAHGLG